MQMMPPLYLECRSECIATICSLAERLSIRVCPHSMQQHGNTSVWFPHTLSMQKHSDSCMWSSYTLSWSNPGPFLRSTSWET